MGVKVTAASVSESDMETMATFVFDYLDASIENEANGGRMRWYPWHSAEYRFNHIMNVVELATEIAEREGADVDVVTVAALFHDIAKLEVEQDRHAEEGATIARKYLETHGDYPPSFVDRVCESIERHSHQGDLTDLSPETRCLVEADMLDKIGPNGSTLMILRMGYEARTHMDAGEMVERVLERGRNARDRIESDTAKSILHQRLKRVKWFREWLDDEIAEMDLTGDED
ncbi:metal dependent phosphohydrolase [Halanaeroarchaeum sulfurireducens]|uniref:Metal dependent phosphohydrolase n=2 Tax=Halanaeroarchaeum sulfurireducens TaxID=1604004 RepID=A0A0N7FTI9_9EURY|nr:HD domain-containing protein [Halanaeroarchaeum sulfurireducens]ALG81687.1 metal dependent phosphohydrolase [Halanaeroarchaeum sulfurireducens]